MAGPALHFRADVRGVVEADVRLGRVAEDTLPGEVAPVILHFGDLLNARPIGRDGRVADHTGSQAGYPRTRARFDPFVTRHAGDVVRNVNVVRKFQRLLWRGTAPEEIIDGGGHGRTGGREYTGTLPWQRGQSGPPDRWGRLSDEPTAGARDCCSKPHEQRQ